MTAPRADSALAARLLLALVLLLAAFGTWSASTPPPPLAADAPADAFSAARAMADVRWIGRAPHPAGSLEHDVVRARLFGRMTALGLTPRLAAGRALKTKVVAGALHVDGGEVGNLIGLLPGRNAALPPLLMMAHYDSVPSSSGAADDGAGVAAALEIVRAVRAGPPLPRTVAILFSDAEEDGLLGARAFFAGDPLARRIGFVVNMDMRGDAGRAIMHETGHGSGGAITLYRRSAVRPTTDSIAAYVEKLIRNSSDFRIAVDHGLPGLNYAFLGRQFDYHAASSTPETLDRGSLQHLGEQVLAVTRALAAAPALPPRSPDPAYASVLGRFVIVYPFWIGWLILAGALALAALAWRRQPVPLPAVLRAAGGALHLLLTLALALALARVATGVPFGFTTGRPLLARWEYYEAALALLGAAAVAGSWSVALAGARRVAIVAPLILAVPIAVAGGSGWIAAAMAVVAALLAVPAFRAPLPRAAIGFGLFGAVAVLAALTQALAPAAAVTPAWSLLGGALILLAATMRRGLPVAALVAALLVAQQAATAHLLLLAVGETIPGVAALFTLFAALALAPLLARSLTVRAGAALAGLLGSAGVVLILAIRFGDPASAARPEVSQVVHVADTTSGRFYRATSLAFPDRWTLAAMGGRAGPVALLPAYDRAFVAPGEPVEVAAPAVRFATLPSGLVAMRVTGGRGTREIRIALASTTAMRAARLNGIPVRLLATPQRMDRISWVGRDPVVTLVFAPSAHGRIVARVSALRDGWPAGARPLPPRPPATMPWYDSDTTLVLATAAFAW